MGGAGGGSSANTDTAYLNDIHEDLLNSSNSALHLIGEDNNIVEVMSSALSPGGNPYSEVLPFHGGTYTQDMGQALEDMGWDVLGWIEAPYIQPSVNAFSQVLDDNIEVNAIPRFEAGMANINAVQSSAFVIGRSVIEGFRNRDISKYMADLRTAMHQQRNQAVVDGAKMRIDSNRVMLIAEREFHEKLLAIREAEYKWRLDVFQHAGNFIAAAHGGTVPLRPNQPTAAQSALGGALAGASIGTEVSPGYGTAIGAVVGGVAGYYSAG